VGSSIPGSLDLYENSWFEFTLQNVSILNILNSLKTMDPLESAF